MKAAVHSRYGGPDVVDVREVERLTPTADQVLVRVAAASVNRADLDYLEPRPSFIRLFLGIRAPRDPRLGLDVAGTVEAVGPDATRFETGARVFGDLYPFGAGAFAEYVAAPERAFAVIPDHLGFELAATLPHSAVLAIQGLRTPRGKTVGAGDRVLIDGASGNVGPFAIQIAKARGANVTAVCRGEHADFVRALGADRVIDYTTTDYTRLGERWDWILASDSHRPLLRVRHALTRGGVYVTLGGNARSIVGSLLMGPAIGRATGRSIGLMLWWKPFNAPDVAEVCDLIADGRVRPAIDRAFPLTQVRDALRYMDDGHARGKVLVVP